MVSEAEQFSNNSSAKDRNPCWQLEASRGSMMTRLLRRNPLLARQGSQRLLMTCLTGHYHAAVGLFKSLSMHSADDHDCCVMLWERP